MNTLKEIDQNQMDSSKKSCVHTLYLNVSCPINCSTDCSRDNLCLCCENVKFSSVLSELREQQELCDGVILLPSGSEIKVHRAILSASSAYFKASFTYNSSSTENTDKPKETVIKADVSDSVMKSFLDYAYTGNCDVSWENVEELLQAADRYEMVGVIRHCCKFLLKELKPKNCIGIFLYAKHFFCKELENVSRNFILSKFCQVIAENEEIERITADELHDILNDEHLNVDSEDIVFDVVRRWIEVDLISRSVHLPKLLSCVRFGLMAYESFRQKFMSWPPIKENSECQKVILPLASKPRIPNQIIMVIGGWSNGAPTDLIEIFDSRAAVWLPMHYTDTRRAYHGVCAIDKKVYVLGGFDGAVHFNSMRCYDPIKYQWEEKACMYQPRCYVSVVVLDRKIYALGGYNGHTRLDSVERYDPDRNQWEMVAPMRRLRSDAGAAVLGENIYVVGGFNGNEVLNSCEMYSRSSDSWTFISFMQSPRSGVGLIAYDDYIYAIGGFSGHHRLNSVERYSIKDLTWNFIAEMMCPRSNFATAVMENKIFVIGGFNGTNTISFVECYDPKINYWQAGTQMNVSRSAQSACVLRGLPNAKGYSLQSKDLEDSPCSLKIPNIHQGRSQESELNEGEDLDNITWEHGAPEPFFD